jgi:hypothetical protein
MIDSALLMRILTVAAALLVLTAAASLAFGAPLSFAGGLGLGFLLGALPIASWSFVAPRILLGKSRALAVALLVLKLGFYSAALYFCVYRKLVHPVGILVGMLAVGTVLILGILLRNPGSAKETA